MSMPGTESSSSARERGARFDLQHHQVVLVLVIDDFLKAGALVADLRRAQPKATDAPRGKLGPAYGALQHLGRFHARKDDPFRAHVERAGDERILQVGHAHNRSERGEQ
jgi:hypothetical protein